MNKIGCLAKRSVFTLGALDIALGKSVKLELACDPETEAKTDLAGDSFFTMYRRVPKPADEVFPDRAVNKALIEWALDEEGMGDVKAETSGKIVPSLMAAQGLWYNLVNDENIKKALEKQKEAEEKAKEAQEEAMKSAQAAQDGDEQAAQEHAEAAQRLMAEARQAAEEGVSKIEKTKEDQIGSVAMKIALGDAERAGEEASAVMKSWGLDPSDPSHINNDFARSLVNNRKMVDAAKYLGRARDLMARAMSNKVSDLMSTRSSQVEMVQDIDNLLTEELAAMSPSYPDVLRAMKVDEFLSTGLLGWLPVEDKKTSGDFIMYVDESGSMGASGCAIAKSIAFGFAQGVKAGMEGVSNERHFSITGFDDALNETVTDDNTPQEIVNWAGIFNAGGTSFEKVFADATERMSKLDTDASCDICLISDGESRVSSKCMDGFLKEKTRLGARLFVIYIAYGGTPFRCENVKEAADVLVMYDQASSFQDAIDSLCNQIAEMAVKNLIEKEG